MKTRIGTTKITDEGVKKHFKNYEPHKSIFELVWNGLDANATEIEIEIDLNKMHGIDSIKIKDNGEGIDFKNIKSNFERFNESTKKNDDRKHGSHGRGRLAFHRICEKASWFTKRDEENAEIKIDSETIRRYELVELDKTDQILNLKKLDSGTCVVLTDFLSNNKLPLEKDLRSLLSIEFGWVLALNNELKIIVNGEKITVPSHEIFTKYVEISNVNFNLKVIRWDEKPSSNKSYNYLITNENIILKRGLSKTNNKISFYTSAYAFSEWLDDYDSSDDELFSEYSEFQEISNQVFGELTEFQRDIYRDFLREFVDKEINKFETLGYFPIYDGYQHDYSLWRKNHTKKIVKNIYLADPQIFNSLNAKSAKILIRLLDKISVSNENDALFKILEDVLDLSDENTDKLAKQLHKTSLDSIISTIELLQRRRQVIHMLREIMDNRSKEVLETPDLQKIIEDNTWLFGPQYTILGAEEDTFTKVAEKLRSQIKDIDNISDADLAEGFTLEGVNRQVDLFLARQKPCYDSKNNPIYKCVIVEIKRPGVSLNKKHLSQIDDYAEIISKHPAFNSEKMRFELILIGRKISKDDFQITNRLDSLANKAEFGLVSDNDKIKCYVKDWYTIFDEFNLSNTYLLEKLKSKFDDYSVIDTPELVSNLQGN